MKRGQPLRRGQGFKVTLDQVRAWQQRAGKLRKRGSDGPWRQACVEIRGEWCSVPGCPHPQPVEIDHLIPKSQGGPSVVQNGWPLCRVHHRMKTDALLLVAPEWLGPDMVRWLSDEGHAEWLVDSVVVGRHCKIFADGYPDRSML